MADDVRDEGLFNGASSATLRGLARALRGGHVAIPLSQFSVQQHAPQLPGPASQTLMQLSQQGIQALHLAMLLEESARAVEARQEAARGLELVWTGPEGPNAHVRDTAVVARELFGSATRSVIVSSFVVHQGTEVFAPLASRMAAIPALSVRVFLHVPRGKTDVRHESELLREFASDFRRQWPGADRPEVYYDPRALDADPNKRATWHAKCVVVDETVAFVSSANFTEWAHSRNVEAGVLIRNKPFAHQLSRQFGALVASGQVRRVPGL